MAGTSSSPSPVASLSMFPLPAELAGDWRAELRLRSFVSGLRLLDLRSSGDPLLGEGGLRGLAEGEAMPLPIALTMRCIFLRASTAFGLEAFGFRSLTG